LDTVHHPGCAYAGFPRIAFSAGLGLAFVTVPVTIIVKTVACLLDGLAWVAITTDPEAVGATNRQTSAKAEPLSNFANLTERKPLVDSAVTVLVGPFAEFFARSCWNRATDDETFLSAALRPGCPTRTNPLGTRLSHTGHLVDLTVTVIVESITGLGLGRSGTQTNTALFLVTRRQSITANTGFTGITRRAGPGIALIRTPVTIVIDEVADLHRGLTGRNPARECKPAAHPPTGPPTCTDAHLTGLADAVHIV